MPQRVAVPAIPRQPTAVDVGSFLWTCRAGFEAPLFEELAWARAEPTLIDDGLIQSKRLPHGECAFARMVFRVAAIVKTPVEAAAVLPKSPAKVQVWTPDTEAGNARASACAAWESTITSLRGDVSDPATPWVAFESGALLAQVCLIAPHTAAVGVVPAREALSLAAAGRSRMRRTGAAPSRAAMKLDEAFEWARMTPEKGDLCVDLGSAPGGWTRRLVERGARVLSVDPGVLTPDLMKHPKVRHFRESAFAFVPPQPCDWLLCDMAWRPLEVALLLAKWARNRWATHLVANLKLPMKDKLPLVWRARSVLEAAGWSALHIRQLYHDRDEVTVRAVSVG